MNQTSRIHGRHRGNGNAQGIQRWGSLIGGSALAIYGLTRRSPVGLALATLGGVVAISGAKANALEEPATQSSVLINGSPEEAYRFWHDFEHFPLFMNHLESVTVTGQGRSRWVAVGPLGTKFRWDAEIVNEQTNQSIAWRSLPGSEIEVDGYVQFEPAPGNRGTLISARIRYRPPAGALGHAVAKMLGKDPNFLMRQDLRRLKALMEAGEIPTTDGQTHGPRSVTAAAARFVDPDRPFKGDVEVAEVFSQLRRVS
ncbi:MAG: cyclase/dehydrase [Acidobacteriales bacterium]|nr:cyclase/dehydrase [Terriglobales bacterium]